MNGWNLYLYVQLESMVSSLLPSLPTIDHVSNERKIGFCWMVGWGWQNPKFNGTKIIRGEVEIVVSLILLGSLTLKKHVVGIPQLFGMSNVIFRWARWYIYSKCFCDSFKFYAHPIWEMDESHGWCYCNFVNIDWSILIPNVSRTNIHLFFMFEMSIQECMFWISTTSYFINKLRT